jgi:hypothetical protein
MNDSKAALRAYNKSLQIDQALAKNHPKNVVLQSDLVISYYKLGKLHQRLLDPEQALKLYHRGLSHWRRLHTADRLKERTKYERWTKLFESNIATCKSVLAALADPNYALAQPGDLARSLLLLRCQVLARRARHVEAAATAAKIRELAGKDGATLYDAARAYAFCAAGVGAGKRLDQFTTQEKARQDGYARRAVQVLEEAVKNGYRNLANIKKDQDLNPLRSREDFKKLLMGLEHNLKMKGK